MTKIELVNQIVEEAYNGKFDFPCDTCSIHHNAECCGCPAVSEYNSHVKDYEDTLGHELTVNAITLGHEQKHFEQLAEDIQESKDTISKITAILNSLLENV